MKIRILTTVSVLAMMAATAMPANAAQKGMYHYNGDNEARYDNNQAQSDAGQALEHGWDRTKQAVENTYDNVRDAVTGEPFLAQSLQVSERNTAQGMIGKNTYTPDGKAVATIEDIIIGPNGDAQQVVMRDRGFLGLGGSLVSVDYDQLARAGEGGDTIQSIDQQTLNRAQRFSYSAPQPGMPREVMSVAQILDGSLEDSQGQRVANVENVTFKNGEADYLIVSFNDVLGFGGDNAAIKFSDLQPVRTDGEVNFRMTPGQSQDFQDYRNMIGSRNR